MYSLIIDTETVNQKNPLVYDVGGAIIDENFNIVTSFSFLVKEVLMYAYENGFRTIKQAELYKRLNCAESIKYIYKYIYGLIKKYNITIFLAYNVSYDKRVLNNTARVFDLYQYLFTSKEFEFIDILKLTRKTIAQTFHYHNFCCEYGFTTPKSYPRVTAEVAYRYITQDIDFKEKHRGLDDVLIELEIYKYINEYFEIT